MCHNRSFLLVALLTSLGFMHGALAVPAVKMLGQKSAVAAPTGTKKVGSNQLSRTGTLSSTGKMVKTANISKPKANTTSLKAPGTQQRLSIGKYIHNSGVNSGVVKPASSSANTASTSGDLVSLADRVQALEAKVETKQDELLAGEGIEIDKGTISVSEDLQNQMDKLSKDKVDVASLSENYYDKGQTQELIEQQVEQQIGQDNKTIYDSASQKRKYVYVVNVFDEGFLEEGN